MVRERDPRGLAGRYLDAVGDPAYKSAFGKLVMDPLQGQMRFSSQEQEAVLKVTRIENERAMAEGTGSAVGSPFRSRLTRRSS